jgi:hypothetical protein
VTVHQRANERGVAIGLVEALPAAPQVFHYENGPIAYRHFVRNGGSWLAVHEAQHDGVGWLVTRTTCRPLVLMQGDHVHCRLEFVEDRGPTVLVRMLRGGDGRDIEIDRKCIVFLDEAPRELPVGHSGNR